METALVAGKRSGSIVALSTLSQRKVAIVFLIAALLAGGLAVAIYKRADIADLFDRSTKALSESARGAGNSPLVKSLAALLGQRSPGERTQGELANDKRRFAAQQRAFGKSRPQQRALGKVQPALPGPFIEALTTPIPQVLPPAISTFEEGNPALANVLPVGSLVSSTPVIVGGGAGGGGGGSGGGGGGGGGGGELPPVVSPVPEPSTWVTMIFGFFILARALRKERGASAGGVGLAA